MEPIYEQTTICAQATPQGQGAIGILRISGPDAITVLSDLFTPSAGAPLKDQPARKAVFGTIADMDGSLIDETLCITFPGPHSYTGEDSAEIYCHGSDYILGRLLQLLLSKGIQLAQPGEFTKRAFLNGKLDLAQAEAVADLISSETRAAHDLAMNQMKGGYSDELKDMRGELLNLVSLMELELDFSEEDVEFADRSRLKTLLRKIQTHIRLLTDSFALGNAIKNGVPVAIIGATNTGKSTLLNALLREDRAIVSDIAGTTRDTIEDTVNLDGVTFRFIDTAGIRSTKETIEMIGIERTYSTIGKASVVLMLLDATRPEYISDSLANLAPRLKDGQKLILLLNKTDLLESAAGGEGAAAETAARTSGSGRADRTGDETASQTAADRSGDERTFQAAAADSQGAVNGDAAVTQLLQKIASAAKASGLSPVAILPLAAKKKTGIEALTGLLVQTYNTLHQHSGATLVTNLRHFEALREAQTALDRVGQGLADQLSTEFIVQDLREALYHIGTITGQVSTDEILGNIFRNFCVGK